MGITVRPAQMSDIPELARVLGIAFSDDPLITWLIRDDATRARRAAALFAAQARHHFVPLVLQLHSGDWVAAPSVVR
ncbi:hypothetical protein [Nocardia sp. NPDC004711]